MNLISLSNVRTLNAIRAETCGVAIFIIGWCAVGRWRHHEGRGRLGLGGWRRGGGGVAPSDTHLQIRTSMNGGIKLSLAARRIYTDLTWNAKCLFNMYLFCWFTISCVYCCPWLIFIQLRCVTPVSASDTSSKQLWNEITFSSGSSCPKDLLFRINTWNWAKLVLIYKRLGFL